MALFKTKQTPVAAAPKLTPLETLQNRSANAVSIIRSTIDQLKATNEAIDAEHAHNDSAGIQIIIQCFGFPQKFRTEHDIFISGFFT